MGASELGGSGVGASSSRRRFLRTLAAAGVGTALFPGLSPRALEAARTRLPPSPPPDPAGAGVEPFWDEVRAAFPLAEGRIPMNAANLAPAPRAVVERTLEVMWSVDGDVSFQNRGRWESLLEETREALARQVGASADEVALVRNTSEANNIVIGGLPLGSGDEVVVFDQNHPTNAVAWDVRAARYGFRVRRVSAPETMSEPREVAEHFIGALSRDTRVLAFSDISNVTGLRLPVAEICRACRERGVHAHVDGAQSLGSVALDLGALGCDSYASSAHKWYMGPKEAGLLFVRREKVDGIWPGVVGVGWGSAAETSARGARKFETLGQRNDATLVGLGAAVEFHDSIGPERIEARVLELAGWLREGLSGIPGLEVVTPAHPDLHHGVVVSRIEGVEAQEVFQSLYRDFGVAGAPTGGLRLCPHVYNTRPDLDRAVEGVEALVGRLGRG